MKQRLLAPVIRNALGLIGLILALSSAALIVLLSIMMAGGLEHGWFLDIFTFVMLPSTFVLGLLLIAMGVWWHRRLERRAAAQRGAPPPPLPVLDLNSGAVRASIIGFALIAVASAILLAATGYKGVEALDSVKFCTQACHTQMQPEAVAHQRSAHANVACVQCHVGPGASWFVKAKINGIGEMVELALNSYPRPIPTPIHNLRPARVVCEQCHWPAAFIGDRLVVHTSYGQDEANSPTKTVLMVHVGGEAGKSSSGIHWHVGHGISVRYLSDPSREHIYTVEVKTADGAVKTFKDSAVPPVDAQWRTMDCVDCHNRPAHAFHDPGEEINAALSDGRIDTSLPFVKREGLRALQTEFPTQQQARSGIIGAIDEFYRNNYPAVASQRASAVAEAGRALADIWSWNVFPQMKVTWNTYPVHLGHQQSPGCWRCHDDSHVAASGEKISQQCTLCHSLVATDDPAPKVLKELE